MQFCDTSNVRMLQLATFVDQIVSSKRKGSSATFCTGVTSDASASANQQKIVRMASGSRETYTRTRVLRTIAGAQRCKSICNSDWLAGIHSTILADLPCIPNVARIRCQQRTSNFYRTNIRTQTKLTQICATNGTHRCHCNTVLYLHILAMTTKRLKKCSVNHLRTKHFREQSAQRVVASHG